MNRELIKKAFQLGYKQAKLDPEVRLFRKNEKTLSDLSKREGDLAARLIELQQQDIPSDAVAEGPLPADGPYAKALSELMEKAKVIPDAHWVGIDYLGENRGKKLDIYGSSGNPINYLDPELLSKMQKIVKSTGTGAVAVIPNENLVSFGPSKKTKLDSGSFTVVPFDRRQVFNKKYGIPEGSTVVAHDVNGLIIRTSDGRFVRKPLLIRDR